MRINPVLTETIDSLLPEYLGIWAEFASIESRTADKAGVDRAAGYICGIAAKKGWKIEKKHFERSGDAVCITMNPDAPGRPLAVSGHVDTVHPAGLFGYPPVRIEEGRICGPGVADCKGGIVAAMMAMDALERVGLRERPVLLLLQTDEETSSAGSDKGTISYICDKAAGAEAFLNAEGHTLGKCTVARKGISKYRLTVRGKSVHAANCTKGISAIAEAAMKITELEKLKDPAGITCSCGTISGGTAINTVPEECSFTLDVRFSNAEETDFADMRVREIAEHSFIPGSSCTVELISRRAAMVRCERNLTLLDRMNAVYEAWGLPVLSPEMSKGGSDAADVTLRGIPCVDSIGVTGGGIHTVREYAEIDSLPAAAKRIATVFYSL